MTRTGSSQEPGTRCVILTSADPVGTGKLGSAQPTCVGRQHGGYIQPPKDVKYGLLTVFDHLDEVKRIAVKYEASDTNH